MKKTILLLSGLLLLTCSRDNFSQIIEESAKSSVNLSIDLGNFFLGGTGAESPWIHQYQGSVDLTFTSTTSVFTKTVTFDPNDLSNFPATSLPYDTYTWSISNTGGSVAVSDVLYVYGNSTSVLSVNTTEITVPLVLSTDFALVTVTTDNVAGASISQNGTPTVLTIKDNYYYAYINSNLTNYTLTVSTSDGLGGADTIATPLSSIHYNYNLNYNPIANTGVTIALSDTFLLEDRTLDITNDGDSDLDGVFDSLDLCPNTRTGAPVDANGCLDVLELDANGVTIKAKAGAQVGDVQEFNGNTYTVVDDTTIRQFLVDSNTAPYLVTTFVTNMNYLFKDLVNFNQNISSWDTSNVTTMMETFRTARKFNQDIGNWDTSNVTDMRWMFGDATEFNQDIGNWDVGNVTNMSGMFYGANLFNQNIENWNVGKVITMGAMFMVASNFNQPLNSWDVSSVQNMEQMLRDAISFNQDISNWNVSNVTNMQQILSTAINFNQDLSSWDVSNVVNCLQATINTGLWTLPKPNFTNCTE
jgi:surface protein